MSEVTGFCYFPLKNYQEFFVIQGSNSGAPTCWVLISRLSCSPSPKVVFVVLLLILCVIIFLVFDVPHPLQSWKYFVGGVFPSLAFTLWGHVFPDVIHSVGCLLLWVVPLPHFLLSTGGRGPVPWEPYCCLCCVRSRDWDWRGGRRCRLCSLFFARLHSCNLSEPERGSSFSSISDLFRTKHCVVQSRRVYWRII